SLSRRTSRRENCLLLVAPSLGPCPLSVILLDGERRRYGRSCEHPVVVRLKCWIGAWRRDDAGPESPVDAEDMDIGNRKAADRPWTVSELSVGDREGSGDVLRSPGARAMHCRGRERHPRDDLCLVLEIAFWPQLRGRILASNVIERGRHLS